MHEISDNRSLCVLSKTVLKHNNGQVKIVFKGPILPSPEDIKVRQFSNLVSLCCSVLLFIHEQIVTIPLK